MAKLATSPATAVFVSGSCGFRSDPSDAALQAGGTDVLLRLKETDVSESRTTLAAQFEAPPNRPEKGRPSRPEKNTGVEIFIRKLLSGDPLAIAFCVAAFSVLATWYSFHFQYRVWNWPSVWGVLTKGKVVEGAAGSFRNGRAYQASVEYDYSVADKDYTGTRLSAMIVQSNMPGLLQKQLQGAETTDDGQVKIYYDPKRPHKSYLIRGSKIQVVLTFLYFLIALGVTVSCAQRLDLI